MKRLVFLGAATLAAPTYPAHANWTGMIYDSPSGVRQATLSGSGENPEHQIVLVCTDGGIDTMPPSYAVMIALPATGRYAVRIGDAARVGISMGDESWEMDAKIDANSSSGFLAVAGHEAARAIVEAMEAGAADMTVSVSAGAIEEAFDVSPDELGAGATEWLEGCGRS